MHPEKLDEPRKWREPKVVFVDSMSDLFHEKISDEFIYRVWRIMESVSRHTYMVLTKRSERMREFLSLVLPAMKQNDPEWVEHFGHNGIAPRGNIWIGVSVENDETARVRITHLLQTAGARRFVSAEPLLGPIDLTPYVRTNPWVLPDYVIIGGESGRGAREMEAEWARSLIRQCRQWGITVHFKQWGEFKDGKRVGKQRAGHEIDGEILQPLPYLPGTFGDGQSELFGGGSL